MNNFTVRQQQEPGAMGDLSPGYALTERCHLTDPKQISGAEMVKTGFSSRGGDGLRGQGMRGK